MPKRCSRRSVLIRCSRRPAIACPVAVSPRKLMSSPVMRPRLVIAEVKLQNSDQPIELPAWLGIEVTHDPRIAARRSRSVRATLVRLQQQFRLSGPFDLSPARIEPAHFSRLCPTRPAAFFARTANQKAPRLSAGALGTKYARCLTAATCDPRRLLPSRGLAFGRHRRSGAGPAPRAARGCIVRDRLKPRAAQLFRALRARSA